MTLDDALYEEALEVAEPGMDKATLFREAVKTFVVCNLPSGLPP